MKDEVSRNYLPHDVNIRIKAVELYRLTKDIKTICQKYNISIASLLRWNHKFDGTVESLLNKSRQKRKGVYSIEVRLEAVNLYRNKKFSLRSLSSMYGFTMNTLRRWDKLYDGSIESLMNKEIY